MFGVRRRQAPVYRRGSVSPLSVFTHGVKRNVKPGAISDNQVFTLLSRCWRPVLQLGSSLYCFE